MLNNFTAQSTKYYLIEVVDDYSGGRKSYPLSKIGSGFTQIASADQAYKFDAFDKAKQACTLQNMMNEVFNSTNKCFVVKVELNNTIYDSEGTIVEPETMDTVGT